MSSDSPVTVPNAMHRRTLVLLSLVPYALGQFNTPIDGNGTPGAVIAGIIVAVCVAIVFLLLFSLVCRRRRRGLTILPRYGGGNAVSERNQNQSPYLSSGYPLVNPQQQGGPPPPPEPMPPPPYPGKPEAEAYEGEENSGYGYPNPPPPEQDSSPDSSVFLPPRGPPPPPAAHVNSNTPPVRHG